MINDVYKHLENALGQFSIGRHYQTMQEAKQQYFDETGAVHEDDDDYEVRMRSFNDWYLLHFVSSEGSPIWNYIQEKSLELEVSTALKTINYSLFEYTGTNFRKSYVLKDLLHDRKIVLDKDSGFPHLMKSEIFLGRVISVNDKFYLMSGLIVLPTEVKPILKREAKKIRKMSDARSEEKFLLKLDGLKNKLNRYGHIDSKRIFIFD